jgi:hypothetical protein
VNFTLSSLNVNRYVSRQPARLMIGKRSERSDDWDKFRTLLLYESWPKYYSARSVLAFLTRANTGIWSDVWSDVTLYFIIIETMCWKTFLLRLYFLQSILSSSQRRQRRSGRKPGARGTNSARLFTPWKRKALSLKFIDNRVWTVILTDLKKMAVFQEWRKKKR